MTISPAGPGRLLVDVYLSAAESPTGKMVRARKYIETGMKDAVKLEAQWTAHVLTYGTHPNEAAPDQAAPAARTLRNTIEMAWKHKTEGWGIKRTGAAAKKDALECAAILGLDTACSKVTTLDYDKIMDALFERGNSPTTVRTKTQNFHRAMWFAERAGWIDRRPYWSPPAKGDKREYIFTPEHEALALRWFEVRDAHMPEYRGAFILGLDLGMRWGEIAAMRPSWVDLDRRCITIPGEYRKGGKIGIVVIWSERAFDTIKAAMERQPADQRLSGASPKSILFPIKNACMSRRMVEIRVQIGRPGDKGVVFHSTRHTAITRMLGSNVPVAFAMAQVDHRSFSTTQGYLHLSPEARLKAITEAMVPA